jgi:hypothetical protein
MVQYLYAAYSLRDDVEQARRWREILMLIAREEMGHLLMVQNILALLGGPIYIDREDYPFHTPFQAFPFQLERLTRGSWPAIAMQKCPWVWKGTRAAEYAAIRADARARQAARRKTSGPKSITSGKLYHQIVKILGDREKIPDHCFVDAAFGQMSWDDWGRSHRGEPAPKTTTAEVAAQTGSERASLFISKVTTREQAISPWQAFRAGRRPRCGRRIDGRHHILRAVRPIFKT